MGQFRDDLPGQSVQFAATVVQWLDSRLAAREVVSSMLIAFPVAR